VLTVEAGSRSASLSVRIEDGEASTRLSQRLAMAISVVSVGKPASCPDPSLKID
jgi:hypothetical protein